MIKAMIPRDKNFKFYKKELRNLYETCKEKITDTNSFNFIIEHTLFYYFIDGDGALIGAIYFFEDDGKLFLNAYGGRKHFNLKIECLKLSTTWFNCDIYSEAQNRASALCLLRAGFKRYKDNIFVYAFRTEKIAAQTS